MLIKSSKSKCHPVLATLSELRPALRQLTLRQSSGVKDAQYRERQQLTEVRGASFATPSRNRWRRCHYEL